MVHNGLLTVNLMVDKLVDLTGESTTNIWDDLIGIMIIIIYRIIYYNWNNGMMLGNG